MTKARAPSCRMMAQAQSYTLFLWYPSCSRCLHTSIGVITRSWTIVPSATAAPAAKAASRGGTGTVTAAAAAAAAAPPASAAAASCGARASHCPKTGLHDS